MQSDLERVLVVAQPLMAQVDDSAKAGDRGENAALKYWQAFATMPKLSDAEQNRLADYPAKPLKGNPMYLPPPGFIEVTKEDADTKVSPHFTLKQFLDELNGTGLIPIALVGRELTAGDAPGPGQRR